MLFSDIPFLPFVPTGASRGGGGGDGVVLVFSGPSVMPSETLYQ